ncbi:MAG: diaminopimelate decarboxylase [Gammaproteobacteria bacterium]|nr:diaminopimelate decarboxylase [Gammaproteobacteria bacterium]
MDHFNYRQHHLYAEDVSVADLVSKYGSPLYVYSRATLERHYRVFDEALGAHPHKICYAVKANSNLAVLNVLARLGAGFDIVSGGELARVLAAGGDPRHVVFSGVGKLAWEIERALAAGIGCFNVESRPELERLNAIAGSMGKVARISIRVNPDVDVKTHPYIATGLKENKFGVDLAEALELYELARSLPGIRVVGVDCHIGSQLMELDPLLDAFDRVYALVKTLKERGFEIEHLDLGGGLGVPYRDETPPSPGDYAKALATRFTDPSLELIVEPGRAIAANAGILLTKVEYLKYGAHKNFAIVDAAMNDLLRPALYDAYQDIIPAQIRTDVDVARFDVVGPVCETGDFLGKSRDIAVKVGDLVAIRTAGAYGFVMSSNYNSRPRAAEVMVDGDQSYLVRERESVTALFENEHVLPGSAPFM